MTVALLWIAWSLQSTPDSAARFHMSQQLRVVSESLSALRGAAARYRRDADKASDHLMWTRAIEVRAGCTGTLAVADSLAVLLAARRYTPPRGESNQRALQADLATLRQALRACRRDWDASNRARADSVRAWGPFRLTALERVLRQYEQRATGFRGYVESPPAPGSR